MLPHVCAWPCEIPKVSGSGVPWAGRRQPISRHPHLHCGPKRLGQLPGRCPVWSETVETFPRPLSQTGTHKAWLDGGTDSGSHRTRGWPGGYHGLRGHPLTHAHTHTHAHSHTHTFTHTFMLPLTNTHTHTYVRAHTLTHIRSHTTTYLISSHSTAGSREPSAPQPTASHLPSMEAQGETQPRASAGQGEHSHPPSQKVTSNPPNQHPSQGPDSAYHRDAHRPLQGLQGQDLWGQDTQQLQR